MIKWFKAEAGEYKSEDGRFLVTQTYDRIYGNHWLLQDRTEPDYYKGQYHEDTLRECKAMAEALSTMNGRKYSNSYKGREV